jgi:glycosyltransferase involved in cell wall biosynthesis
MKLLEYMSMERATVAPRLPNIQDLIDDGVDGLLFTPDDVDALAATLRRLTGDEALRRAIGQRGRWTVMHVRNWRRNADRVLRAVTQGVMGPASADARARVDVGARS